ncbi:uncharacterized protein [Elaeis guineensis]|uniref:Uncharacterized protein LOC105044365 n=1 Tax=Elaeis guineensis var. tenera TaxID=51953 RepID=A0A6I9R4M2_ELAGV|nr:uncharacterized protein LOC105044365 [Elaeis guineensis]
MAAVTISPSLLPHVSAPNSLFYSTSKIANSTLPPPSSALLRPLYYHFGRVSTKRSQLGRVSAASGDVLPSEATIEKAQQIPPAAAQDGGVSTVVSALLLIAFISLSILTIGVIYLAVQDFLQKREREKFEKEEAAKKKKSGKKGKVKARAGPRGFGQKIEEDDD